ncbi:MAG: flagellar biosynthesis protein FlhF, partial [Pirellulales bacterium]|nr:flagellar biosynthesis protein FlhF [Pirellulales bacterium]
SRSLISTAKKFTSVGTTSMLITKLDEATCLGNLLGLARDSGLPISYLTDGQNVPDDIQVAQATGLAQLILGSH